MPQFGQDGELAGDLQTAINPLLFSDSLAETACESRDGCVLQLVEY